MKVRAGGGNFRAGGGSFRAAGCSPLLFLFMGNTSITVDTNTAYSTHTQAKQEQASIRHNKTFSWHICHAGMPIAHI